MHRRAWTLLVGIAATMGVLAFVVSYLYDRPLLDPEGSFLGPTWLRLPLLLLGALLLDLLPRTLWFSRGNPKAMPGIVRERLRTHWDRDRLTLVALGVFCFYITYVSYRNLKSVLPEVIDTKYDRELHLVDRVLMFGGDPSDVLHAVLGTGISAHVLSYIYLWFLPLVPIALTAWLVFPKNLSYGYWFATSQCIAWTLGTLSYYLLPTLGPGFEYSAKYKDVVDAGTPSGDLMDSLSNSRATVLSQLEGAEGLVNSVAGFASLHTAITLLVALMVQFTLQSRTLKIVFWVNFGITVVATLYFGWHYILDDVAGIFIAFVAFYVGGLASGQKFERGSLRSHPTTTTDKVPVDR
ncbi:phosphatase PAP2 family protein [Nocardioides aquaticus]|uniref:phosphatase PAP2 family protein n=1 Tax=Nocardioides aquaticus TaxID=160826 RepID=UPI0031CE4F7B